MTFHASHLQFLVLDEADRLFEEQFVEPITEIVARLPPVGTRQTMLFSATITQDMLEANQGFVPSATAADALTAARKASADAEEDEGEEAAAAPRARLPALMKDPVFIQVSSDEDAFVHTLDQRYLFMPQAVKEVYLTHILQPMKPDHDDYAPSKSVIVFTSTCRGCEFVAELLTRLGVPCAALHSHVSQQRRLAALGKFRSGLVKVLVATDVASRGLDIPSVTLVINYDVPRSLEDYVHRTGRTARAGRGGRAVSFVSQYDIEIFKSIEAFVGKQMEQYDGAAEDDVLEHLKEVNEAKKITKLRLAEYELTAKKFRAGDAEVVDEKAVKAETKRRFQTAGIGLAKQIRGAKQQGGGRSRQGQVKRRQGD
jgi:ATP-dependent RNA helicase DDX49/DBP8